METRQQQMQNTTQFKYGIFQTSRFSWLSLSTALLWPLLSCQITNQTDFPQLNMKWFQEYLEENEIFRAELIQQQTERRIVSMLSSFFSVEDVLIGFHWLLKSPQIHEIPQNSCPSALHEYVSRQNQKECQKVRKKKATTVATASLRIGEAKGLNGMGRGDGAICGLFFLLPPSFFSPIFCAVRCQVMYTNWVNVWCKRGFLEKFDWTFLTRTIFLTDDNTPWKNWRVTTSPQCTGLAHFWWGENRWRMGEIDGWHGWPLTRFTVRGRVPNILQCPNDPNLT